jgi:hypothetical protein
MNRRRIDGGIITPQGAGMGLGLGSGAPLTMDAVATGSAFLQSELELRDPLVRQPLMSVTYLRDVPMQTGGGWDEFESAINIDYGVAGGSNGGLVSSAGSNSSPVIQMNLNKDPFMTHIFDATLRIGFIDMQRMQNVGQSLDYLLTEGVKKAYAKHMDINTYLGFSQFGTVGLINNTNVTATSVSGSGSAAKWINKTPSQILADINALLTTIWANSGYDREAIPNHVLLPYSQYTYIATAQVGTYNDKTILTFLEENNITKANGGELVIGAVPFCAGAGVGATDRMVAYVHNERFLAMRELQPLTRTMTQPNVDAKAYDSVYMANIGQVKFFYTATIAYADGL